MSNSTYVYQQYIHKSRYARFIEEEKDERVTETVSRYFDFMSNHLKTKHKHIIPTNRTRGTVINLDVMPSMRTLMIEFSLERDHTHIIVVIFLLIVSDHLTK